MVKIYINSFTDKGNCVAIDFGPRLFLVHILSIYLSKLLLLQQALIWCPGILIANLNRNSLCGAWTTGILYHNGVSYL